MIGKKRFRLGALLALLALVLVVAGCGGGDDDEESAASAPASTETPDLKGVELEVWIPPVLTEAQKQLFPRFEQATGATVKTRVFPLPFEQNLLTKWATGDRPDVMFWHALGNWIVQLNPGKNLVDLSKEPFVERTNPDFVDQSIKFDGTVYAALLNHPSIYGVLYNKPLFERLGLEIPTNYDELLQTCETIKSEAPDVSPLVSGGGDSFPLQIPVFTLWGSDLKEDPGMVDGLNTAEVKFTDPRFVDGITKFKNLIDQGCYNDDIKTAKFTDEQKRLIGGEAAMIFQPADQALAMYDAYGKAKVDKTVGYFPLASGGPVAQWQTAGAAALFVPKTGDEKKEAAAKAFLEWTTGAGYQDYVDEAKFLPVIEGTEDPAGAPPIVKEARDALEQDGVPQFQQTLKAAYGPFETFLSEMVAGQKTPEQVAESLQSEFTKSARQVGLEGF